MDMEPIRGTMARGISFYPIELIVDIHMMGMALQGVLEYECNALKRLA
jgi:hypothetical protein